MSDEETTAAGEETGVPESELSEADLAEINRIQGMITPDRMFMPFVLDQQEVVTDDGRILTRYVLGFVNQAGQTLAAVGPNDTRVLANLVFTNDTGRRTLPRIRRANGNGPGRFDRGSLPR